MLRIQQGNGKRKKNGSQRDNARDKDTKVQGKIGHDVKDTTMF